MRPGVPWSVKGIDDEARQAAKSAAREAGLTLGQWLNTVIKESADGDYGAQAGHQQSPHTSHHSDDEIKDRLDKLADQLSSLTQQGQDTAVARFMQPAEPVAPAESGAIEAIVGRIDTNERRADTGFAEINERLRDLAEQLSALPASGLPERPEDVPGFTALETALRNIVDHIEQSEQRSSESLAGIQQQMAEIAARATDTQNEVVSSTVPAIASLEQRFLDLAERVKSAQPDQTGEIRDYVDTSLAKLSQRIDAVRHSADAVADQAQSIARQSASEYSEKLEVRLRSVVDQALAAQAPAPDITGLQKEIESLNQRVDDIKAETASERDVQALQTAIEKLSQQIDAGPDLSPVSELDKRLGELASQIEQSKGDDGLGSQVGELARHVQDLDARVQEALAGDDQTSGNDAIAAQIASVNDRLAATEQKLGHLETIDRSIAQLFDSIEQNRAWAKEVAEEAASRIAQQTSAEPNPDQFAPSSELQALKEGLGAVRASAELSDKRNQETLEAVHDTLEQIINKLADVERSAPTASAPLRDVAPDNELVAPEDTSMQAMSQVSPPLDPAEQATPASNPFAQFAEQANDANGTMQAQQARAAPDPDFVLPPDPFSSTSQSAEPAPQPAAAMSEPLGQVPDSIVAAPEEAMPPEQPVATVPPLSEPPVQPPLDVEREDFIAAARRAAQTAAPQNRASLLGNLNIGASGTQLGATAPDAEDEKSGSIFSLPFLRRGKAAQTEEPPQPHAAAGTVTEPAEAQADAAVNGKRRQLILAGLIVLAAVSAYSMSGYNKKPAAPKPVTPAPSATEQETGDLQQLKDSLLQARRTLAATTDESPALQPLTQSTTRSDRTAKANRMADLVSLSPGPVESQPSVPLPSADPVQTASFGTLAVNPSKSDSDISEKSGAMPAAAPRAPATDPDAQQSPGQLPEAIGSESLRKAAMGGDANAQFVIASRYLDGKLVPQDFKEAANWYRKAAAQGLAPAQYRLGTMFERGRGLPKDMTAARLWYERAAERKNVKSMHNLAVIYSNNQGGDAQFELAAKWFTMAAGHGLRDSLYNLAVLHERGLGVPEDMNEAYFWFGVGARHGDADAGAKFASVKRQVPDADRAKLDARIAAWAPEKPDASGNLVSITDPSWNVSAGPKPAPQPTADETPAVQVSNADLILKAQQLLSDMGYDVGPQDGVMGSRTANAVRLYQLQTGQQVNGTVSEELIQNLEAPRG